MDLGHLSYIFFLYMCVSMDKNTLSDQLSLCECGCCGIQVVCTQAINVEVNGVIWKTVTDYRLFVA